MLLAMKSVEYHWIIHLLKRWGAEQIHRHLTCMVTSLNPAFADTMRPKGGRRRTLNKASSGSTFSDDSHRVDPWLWFAWHEEGLSKYWDLPEAPAFAVQIHITRGWHTSSVVPSKWEQFAWEEKQFRANIDFYFISISQGNNKHVPNLWKSEGRRKRVPLNRDGGKLYNIADRKESANSRLPSDQRPDAVPPYSA